jgi:S-adenosylmethionine decarboxylase
MKGITARWHVAGAIAFQAGKQHRGGRAPFAALRGGLRPMDTLGRHLLIELWGCRRGTDDCEMVRQALVESVAAVRATILHLHVHAFSPHGVTGVAVLAESHMSVHTWPEHGYVAADVFTCGETADPLEAVEVLRTAFQAECVELRQIVRGTQGEAGRRNRESLDSSYHPRPLPTP